MVQPVIDLAELIGRVPSDLYSAFARLSKRLRFKGDTAAAGQFPGVSNTVVAVTDFDTLLRVPGAQVTTENISASAGTYVPYFTVTNGKRWTIQSAYRGGTASNTTIRVKVAGTTVILTGSSTAESGEILPGIILNESDSIGMVTTGNGSDNDTALAIHYFEEDAF